MAFDACLLSCVVDETNELLKNGKVEKIYQPSKNEIIINVRTFDDTFQLYMNAGSQSPRFHISKVKCDNPAQPPVFCMFLRKHLLGSKLLQITQMDFERVAMISFSSYDEMGYPTEKHLYCEIMGKYSNIMLCDVEDKVLSVLHPVDFSMSQKRQVLPGMKYELPPSQDKLNPMTASEEEMLFRFSQYPSDTFVYKVISSSLCGIAVSTAKQLSYLWFGDEEALLNNNIDILLKKMKSLSGLLSSAERKPTIEEAENGEKLEYSFLPFSFFSSSVRYHSFDSFGEMLDDFFVDLERKNRNRTNGDDILQMLHAAESRLQKKRQIQFEELAACERGNEYKLYGDLLTANLYRLKKGMKQAELENYYDSYQPMIIPLDERLTPSANAQKYYKKYAKSKSAMTHISMELEKSETELSYLASVREEFSRVDGDKELDEIRNELAESGYFRKKKKEMGGRKKSTPSVMTFLSTDGRKIVCGKNNIANDYVTFRLASKNDWWFHAKLEHGSHVVMIADENEPTDRDFTEAAEIAAFYSGNQGSQIPVDYTKVKNVKKPPNAAPGYVIYHTNWTAYVTPDGEKLKRMKKQ